MARHSIGGAALVGALLCLCGDAFGGDGGIAQYNRDFVMTLAERERFGRIEILPRLAPDPIGPLPKNVQQRRAIWARAPFAVASLFAAARIHPGVVFCGHLYMAPLSAFLADCTRAKLIVQLHGLEVWRRPTAAQIRSLRRADLVLCVSHDTRARALEFAPAQAKRFVVVPNTVADDFTPGDGRPMRERLGVNDKRVLLSVSRLDTRQRHKGHERVMQCLPGLCAAGYDVVYVIAGDGSDRPRLEKYAHTLGVESHVRFLGQVPRADLPDLYRAADLFVLPSTGEGFGIVYLEAMACGTPALGLAVGGATEALRNGELGEAVAEAEFPAALARLLEAPRPNPDALSLRVRNRFGRAAYASRLEQALDTHIFSTPSRRHAEADA